jgi:serine/threonine protein kinase
MPEGLRERLDRALGSAYVLERELGGGGMARVFVARERALGRTVVLKVLAPELAADVSAARFAREVRLAARLQHPHIVPLLSAGDADGLPYYTMPFVAELTLRGRLEQEGALPPPEAVGILRDVASALAHAHAHGVVHRDVKPDNVLLAGGEAIVTDFGIAKALNDSRTTSSTGDWSGERDPSVPTFTRIGVALGTPAYMAPEQAAGDPSADHRADLYAWGVLAYELLAGAPPFTARAPWALVRAHLVQPPPPLDEARAGLPPSLVALVMQCLAKAPADRPADAAELLRRLGPADGAAPASAAARGWDAPRRRVIGWAAAALALAAALAGAAWVWRS